MTDTDSSLRDIRPDLKLRLQEAVARRDDFRAKADEAERDVDMYQRLIERENQRYHVARVQAQNGVQRPTEELSDFLFRLAQTNPTSKIGMMVAAKNAGYNIDGRSIHATTVNLQRSGRLIEENGIYRAAH